MTYLERIISIAETLARWNVPHEVKESVFVCGFGITFPWCDGDVCCNDMTYGNDCDMVETYRFPWDKGDVSVMYPYEAACRIIDYYKKKNPNK